MVKFISLLGKGRYIPCNYYLDNERVDDCCYIQQAIIEILVRQGMAPDSIVIFTTKDAKKTNWIKNNFDEKRRGLHDELEIIRKGTGSHIILKEIPDGKLKKNYGKYSI